MDLGILKAHLAQAEAHVLQGEHHIAEQQARIVELERDGHTQATMQAWDLLAVLRESQSLHVRNRDRMRRELALLTDKSTP